MTSDSIERIERLKRLRDSGDITNTEYDAMKAEVLSDVGGSARVDPEPYAEPTVYEPVHHSQKFCALRKQSIPRGGQVFNAPCSLCGVPLPAKNRYVMVSYDSDGKVVSYEGKPGPAWWKLPATIVGVLVLIVSFVVAGDLVDGTNTSRPPSVGRIPSSSFCGGSVRYVVSGTARSVSITMENRQGNTEQLDEVSVPFQTTVGKMGCGEFVYISAQNQGSSGTVTCTIQVDGKTIETASSSGEYVIASCSGRVPRS